MKTGRAHSLADSMKRLMAAVWVLLGIVLLGSCSEEGIEVDEVNKQTIFVYMPWSGSANDEGLYSCFLANLDSIEAAIKNKGGLDKSRLVVFLSESSSSSKLYEVRVLTTGRTIPTACRDVHRRCSRQRLPR